MPLNFFYTMVQKSQKWPKTQSKGGGPALNRVVRGPTIPGPASFSNWYGISSDPDDLLAGRDRRALLTSDAQMLSKVKTEDRMEGQTGKASWLREAFEFINVSFSNSAFPLSEPTIFCDDARRGGISTCGVPFRSQSFLATRHQVEAEQFGSASSRCTRVKVIRVEVSQNVVHARTTGWMTSTRPGKLRDFGLQPRRSNPRSRNLLWALGVKSTWFLNFGGQAKCKLILVGDSWPSLVVFGVVIPLWVKKHE